MEKIQSFTSTDGTTISYRTTGSGPSVVVIPGSLFVAADYEAIFVEAPDVQHYRRCRARLNFSQCSFLSDFPMDN